MANAHKKLYEELNGYPLPVLTKSNTVIQILVATCSFIALNPYIITLYIKDFDKDPVYTIMTGLLGILFLWFYIVLEICDNREIKQMERKYGMPYNNIMQLKFHKYSESNN